MVRLWGFLIFGVALLPALCGAETAKIYTWTDKSGVPHFSNRPPGPDDQAADVRTQSQQVPPRSPGSEEEQQQSLDRMVEEYIDKPRQEKAKREEAEKEARAAEEKDKSKGDKTALSEATQAQVDAMTSDPFIPEDKKQEVEKALWLRLQALKAYEEQQQKKPHPRQ